MAQAYSLKVKGINFILDLEDDAQKDTYADMLEFFSNTKTGRKILDCLSPDIPICIKPRKDLDCLGATTYHDEVYIASDKELGNQMCTLAHELSHEITHQKGLNPSICPSFETFFETQKRDELNSRLVTADMYSELRSSIIPHRYSKLSDSQSSLDLDVIHQYEQLGLNPKEAREKWVTDILKNKKTQPASDNLIRKAMNRFLTDAVSTPILGLFIPKSVKKMVERQISDTFAQSDENQFWNAGYTEQAFSNYLIRKGKQEFLSENASISAIYDPLKDFYGLTLHPNVWKENLKNSDIIQIDKNDNSGNIRQSILRLKNQSLVSIFDSQGRETQRIEINSKKNDGDETIFFIKSENGDDIYKSLTHRVKKLPSGYVKNTRIYEDKNGEDKITLVDSFFRNDGTIFGIRVLDDKGCTELRFDENGKLSKKEFILRKSEEHETTTTTEVKETLSKQASQVSMPQTKDKYEIVGKPNIPTPVSKTVLEGNSVTLPKNEETSTFPLTNNPIKKPNIPIQTEKKPTTLFKNTTERG